MAVLLPEHLTEALEMLAEAGEHGPIPMAGGTDLMVHWPANLAAHDRTYIDLSGIAELRSLSWGENELVLGGMTSYWQTIRDRRVARDLPMLVAAARQVGAVQIQTRGTWAGNIVNASPAADGVPVLMAYDAEIELRSATETTWTPLADFYTGYKQMRRRPDQLITAIRVPVRNRDVQIFEKVGSRAAQAITKIGVAIVHSEVDGWRIVANSMAPTVCRCRALEAFVQSGESFDTPDDLLPAIRRDLSPIDDIRSTGAYRERVFSRVLFYALRQAGRSRREG